MIPLYKIMPPSLDLPENVSPPIRRRSVCGSPTTRPTRGLGIETVPKTYSYNPKTISKVALTERKRSVNLNLIGNCITCGANNFWSRSGRRKSIDKEIDSIP